MSSLAFSLPQQSRPFEPSAVRMPDEPIQEDPLPTHQIQTAGCQLFELKRNLSEKADPFDQLGQLEGQLSPQMEQHCD